jgi:tetratricopeptide (TPR) repeat protein
MWNFCKKGTVAASLIAINTADGFSTRSGSHADSVKALEQALSVYDQFLKPGSAAALNQIAAAYFTLGENAENASEYQKAKEYFLKAAVYFERAAETGCREAVYNVGLVHNKLKLYDKAALYYRKCINNCVESEPDLALKAAINLSILVMEKKVPEDADEIVEWVNLCQKYNKNPKAAELLQTSVVILTDINSLPKAEIGNEATDAGAVVIPSSSTSLDCAQNGHDIAFN